MFGLKKKQALVFGALQQVLLQLASVEWANVVTAFSELEIKRAPPLCPIPSKFPELRELFLECLAFHSAALHLTALRSIGSEAADYVTRGTIQEISFSLNKYLGSGCDRAALQNRIHARVSKITASQQFEPDMPEDSLLENFENSMMGQHSLATLGFLKLSEYSPEANLVIIAGRTVVVGAKATDLYQKALEHSLPVICLTQHFEQPEYPTHA